MTAADKLLRGDGDNESVGLIICKTAKKTIVEWSLKDINKPLGVSTYQLEEVVVRTPSHSFDNCRFVSSSRNNMWLSY